MAPDRSQRAERDGPAAAACAGRPLGAPGADLELADWRRQVGQLYAAVRAERDPERGHARWRAGRDRLLREHPQSPLAADDPFRESGVPYWPYDPGLRFELSPRQAGERLALGLATGDGETTVLRLVGWLDIPAPVEATVALWWLDQYGGGLFLPLRDGTAGSTTYGGGRYVLDGAKRADLGGDHRSIVVDLNFSYHPSCRYSSDWRCPLAPEQSRIATDVRAGERLAHR